MHYPTSTKRSIHDVTRSKKYTLNEKIICHLSSVNINAVVIHVSNVCLWNNETGRYGHPTAKASKQPYCRYLTIGR